MVIFKQRCHIQELQADVSWMSKHKNSTFKTQFDQF